MIVSGFTLRKGNVPAEEMNITGQHNHCMKCYLMNCSKFADNVSTCLMMYCDLCGWRCHECKMSEHTLICAEERVFCLNKEYGCPHLLKRSKMAAHLTVCPASVVFCAEEWSRWPMHAREQGKRMPLPQEKSCLECGQLDVGLAMRDQRMLIDSLRAPRKLRHMLRNTLTQKYPAAPFPHWRTSFDSDTALSEATSQTISDDESDAPWDLSKSQPGLKESIRSRLYLVTKETADSLAAALEKTTNILSSQNRLLEKSESENGSIGNVDEESAALNPDFLHTSSVLRHLSPSESRDETQCNSLQLQFYESPFNTSVEANTGNIAESNLKLIDQVQEVSPDRLTRSSISSDRFSDSSTRLKSTLHDIGGTQLHKLMGLKANEGDKDEICLHRLLGVSINMECINKYVIKPASMYTFICAQNFRRDEYPWHFKNVHLDIHTGLCGWLEQRCPLANLGCTFSFHRMEPKQTNTSIYHSWLQESFGLRSNLQPMLLPNESSTAISHSACIVAQSSSETDSLYHNAQENSRNNVETTTITKHPTHNEPSISDLAKFDKENDTSQLKQSDSNNKTTMLYDIHKSNSSDALINGGYQSDSCEDNNSTITDVQSNSFSQDGNSKSANLMSVQPTVYTASNWNSKVLFQYNLEADDDVAGTCIFHNLLDLPFEILRHIALHLDSFSLCNLSLACHQLRDVCCSLLNDRGIVLFNWQKQRPDSSGRVKWRVVSKRWMFSTSFEPIQSWRFVTNSPTIGEHLKVCPYNKDKLRHTAPVKLLM